MPKASLIVEFHFFSITCWLKNNLFQKRSVCVFPDTSYNFSSIVSEVDPKYLLCSSMQKMFQVHWILYFASQLYYFEVNQIYFHRTMKIFSASIIFWHLSLLRCWLTSDILTDELIFFCIYYSKSDHKSQLPSLLE